MKKTLLLLAAAALVLILAAVGLLAGLFSRLRAAQEPRQALEPYLEENWPVFTLRAWDAETGRVELDYSLRFTYAQMEQYGARLEELRAIPAGNLATVADLKIAVRERVGITLAAVTVYGVTSDGQIAYVLHPDGSVDACWEQGPLSGARTRPLIQITVVKPFHQTRIINSL